MVIAKNYYGLIREVYKYHAGLGTNGQVLSVPLNQFTNFLNDIKVMDS